MPGLVLLLLVAAAVAIALRGRPTSVAVVLVGTWLLVPGAARVPGTGIGPLFIHRVVVAAALAGLVWQVATGGAPRRLFALRGVHVAFFVYLAVAAACGVVFAPPGAVARQNADPWIDLAFQAVSFIVALALFRSCGARRSIRIIAGVAGVMAVIAISERLVGWSYARWFARDIADPSGLMTLPLERRGGTERVRAAATFALEFGWVAALLIPVTVAAAIVWHRRRLMWLAPALLGLALVLSVSRSVYAGLALALSITMLGVVLDRPRQVAVVVLGALVVTALVIQIPLREAIDTATLPGEPDVRLERLPEMLGAVADRPYTGLGLGGLLARNVDVVDSSWVLVYATLGVLGVLALAALLLICLHALSRFLRAGPGDSRVIAASATGVVAAAVVALAAYDFGTLRMSTATLWMVVALGLTANEELGVVPEVARVRRPSAVVAACAAAGLWLGVGILAVAPERSSATLVVTTVDPRIAAAAIDQSFTVKVLSQTACSVLDDMPTEGTVRCQDLDQIGGGIAEVRIEGVDDAEVERTRGAVEQRLTGVFSAATLQEQDRGRGRPAWATTAPLWAAVLGALAGLWRPVISDGRTDRPGSASAGPGPDRRALHTSTRAG